MHRASSAALHSWRTTRLARRVSSANAVARLKRPATTTPTDDTWKPDLQLSHFLAMERSSMKILHLEPLPLGSYSPRASTSPSVPSSSKLSPNSGEPKSDAPVDPPTNGATVSPPPSRSAQKTAKHALRKARSISAIPQPARLSRPIQSAVSPLDQDVPEPQVRHRFYHNHLTEAIRKRRVESAWQIYLAQRSRTRKDGTRGGRSVPTALVHSLFALLAGAHPQTRQHYVRMRELADLLRRRGPENVREWEWNAMINAAGRGFRGTTADDYRTATEVLEEWEAEVKSTGPNVVSNQKGSAPSIRTYNILVSIAAKTGNRALYQDALRRLEAFSGKPDSVTYLAQITRYQQKGQLDKIPPLIERMIADGWRLRTDGANAILWAYADHGHLDIAQQIYNTMKPYTPSSPSPNPSHETPNPILSIPSILTGLKRIRPDHRTYIMMLQAYAQAGQLTPALDVLQDYLTAISTARKSRRSLQRCSLVRASDKQMTAAFRGLFLGFVKYGAATPQLVSKRALAGMSLKEAASALLLDMSSRGQPTKDVAGPSTSHFTTETLLSLFRFYLVLTASYTTEANHPITLPPTQFVRTILLAFKNTAAPDEANALLNEVWRTIVNERLEPCGRKWTNQRDTWVWMKIRRDFRVDERTG